MRQFLRVLALLAVGLTAACGGETKIGELCWPLDEPRFLATALPPPPEGKAEAAKPAKGQTTVWWDGSQSLAGYIDASTETLRPLGDLQPILARYARDAGGGARWLRFAAKVDTPILDPAEVGAAGFYRCSGCDNQESHVDTVFQRIAAQTGPGLNVVVTDLWLYDPKSTISPIVAMGGPVKSILADGRAIAVIGIKAAYAGGVTDIPHAPTYHGARSRPLFVLLVGTPQEVLGAYDAIQKAGSPALLGANFA